MREGATVGFASRRRAGAERPRRLRLACAAAAALIGATAAAAPLELRLEDQFGAPRLLRTGAGRPVIAAVSGRRTAAEELAAWAEALEPTPPGVEVYAVADLRAIPFFVPRAAVTKQLVAEYPDRPILLDWKGSAASALGAAPGGTTAIAFGPGGEERARESGEASRAGAGRLRAAFGPR